MHETPSSESPSKISPDGSADLAELREALALARGDHEENDSPKPDLPAAQQEQVNKQLSLVAQKTTTGVVITDAKGRFTWVNEAFVKMTGFRLQDILGKTPGSVLQGPATDQTTVKHMHDCVHEGNGFHVEILNYRKSGVPYWIEVDATPVHEVNGELSGFIAIENDITNRKLDRERIEESERRFRDISNAAGEYIWEHDENGQFTYVTDRVRGVLGYSPGEFVGFHSVDLIPPEQRSEFLKIAKEIIGERRSFRNVEIQTRHKNGHFVWQSISGVPMYDRKGDFAGYRGAALDITSRKKIEQELSTLNERFKIATTSASIGIWEYDAIDNRMVWDTIMHELFRLPPKRFLGTLEAWAQVVAPEDLTELRNSLSTAIEKGGNYRLNFRAIWPGGDMRHITGNVLVLLDNSQRATRMIGSCWDVTDQKRAEEKALQARDEAEAANRAKSAFLAMISHEIRTPMNGVVGMIEALSTTKLNDQQLDYLQTISASGDSLLRIINDILDYSKVEAGRFDLEDRPFRLATILDEAVSLFSAQAADKGIELVYRLDSTTPNAIRGDETRVRQVLVNLVSNAVKFTERGRVTVKISAKPIDSFHHEIHCSVADTGIGISVEQHDKLFQPFTQADPSTTRRYGGSGLGLAVSKRIVRMMKGKIWFDSSRLLGTIFHFTFPASHAELRELPPPTRERNRGPLKFTKTVLIAEDNPVNCKVAEFLLKRMNVTIEVAENGSKAVKQYQENKAPVILMDVQMPEMDGIEATKVIRSLTGDENAPWIIGLSAAALKEDEATARAAGMNDFIVKPLKSQDLEAALGRALASLNGAK